MMDEPEPEGCIHCHWLAVALSEAYAWMGVPETEENKHRLANAKLHVKAVLFRSER
jgi:hypothetical protein